MLDGVISAYLKLFPAESGSLAQLIEQITSGDKLNNRKNFRGHITAGGLVLSPDKKRLLLVHHRASGLWLHPAGHWDAEDKTPLDAARREIAEETSASLKTYIPILPANPLVPLDIDTHPIAANPEKQEAAHDHHDFRYVFIAENEAIQAQEQEVSSVKWLPLDDVAQYDHFRKVLRKLDSLLGA